ncbi:5-oxoprolinase subunit PxpB [Salinimicrobium xinjiangense]|uniref:5-oxoprolinase subunit PxpB n=1 Tax=Salinimicrobium xinjiangense TaxID=438596 RepID=UPI0003F6C531|nr:5-oxoprolinase subunit PxpB [Salinimicrobium xinjiangense]
MDHFPKIRKMGERAYLVEFEQKISAEVLQKVLFYKEIIQKKLIKEKVEVINTYNSLLITWHESIEDAYSAFRELEKLIETANIQEKSQCRIFRIPVCYDESFGLDLAEISSAKNLSREEIIRLHSSANYVIYFIGFLPGFLYLGGLPDELHFPRRKEPRLEVQKGAVGIGEKQTGIYPQKSPGGWNIIGNSPVPLFEVHSDPPSPFLPGDRIRFYPVSGEEHEEISKQVESGEFKFKMAEDES